MNVSGSVGRMTQQISMWEGYESLIRSGVKKQTVRYRDPFDVGDAVIVFEHDSGAVTEIPARVTGVRTVRRDELTEDDALADGFESFSDSELTSAVGGARFDDLLASSGLSPEQAMSFALRVDLPGEVVAASGTEVAPGVIEWRAPLDGSELSVQYHTVQRPASDGNSWAAPLSTIALVALVAWVVVAAAFIGFVVVARRSKRRRRERALRHLR